jgi:acetylornithine deacetylase/succinyl-diaminopimelate desuccinylase-like protein
MDKQLQDRIHSTIDQNFDNQQAFLLDLLAINSARETQLVEPKIEDTELGVAGLIRNVLRSFGVKADFVAAEKKRPNVVGKLGPLRSRKSLILNAHMDTESPTNTFRGDPYTPFVRGGKIYGLGVLHMKASIAAFIYAARALQELNLPLAGKLWLQFVVDGTAQGSSELGTHYLLNKGFAAKAAIIGSSGKAIGVGHRGGYRFKLTTHGESIRTTAMAWQRKEKGKNAITEMMRAIRALQAWELPYKAAKAFPGQKPVFSFPTVIRGGKVIHAIPESCVAWGDVQLMPGNSDKQVRIRIEELLDELPGLQYDLEDLVYIPAVEIDHKEEIVEHFSQAFQNLGEKPEVGGIGTWNDGWMFIQRDIPAIVQTPLEGDIYRGNHEWVDLASLKRLTKAVTLTAVNYLGLK